MITADIYETIGEEEMKKCGPGLDTECVGGGRINHNAEGKTIKVYGYSQVGESYRFLRSRKSSRLIVIDILVYWKFIWPRARCKISGIKNFHTEKKGFLTPRKF